MGGGAVRQVAEQGSPQTGVDQSEDHDDVEVCRRGEDVSGLADAAQIHDRQQDDEDDGDLHAYAMEIWECTGDGGYTCRHRN